MENKIVMDSAGDLQEFDRIPFACAPLKILAGDQEFVDDRNCDIAGMVSYLRSYKGKASTACPSVGEYLDAFGDAENVYCITITSGLSGSYNAAAIAAQTFLEQHPTRKIHVFDSLSAGAEMALVAEKIRELVLQGLPFEAVVEQTTTYMKTTRLMFSLESLHNLANNGRVPPAVAKVAGILGIRLLGKASDEGTLQPTGKARGEKKVAPELMRHLTEMGYVGGKMRICHCFNQECAFSLRDLILTKFPTASVAIAPAGALCSFYAEQGGLMIGFEV